MTHDIRLTVGQMDSARLEGLLAQRSKDFLQARAPTSARIIRGDARTPNHGRRPGRRPAASCGRHGKEAEPITKRVRIFARARGGFCTSMAGFARTALRPAMPPTHLGPHGGPYRATHRLRRDMASGVRTALRLGHATRRTRGRPCRLSFSVSPLSARGFPRSGC